MGNRKIAYVGALVLLLAVPPLASGAGPDPGVNVTVTNRPSNPVPVTGSIGLSGTANVNVTNTAAAPIPVSVINATTSGDVACYSDSVDSGGLYDPPFLYHGVGTASLFVTCPEGVSGIATLRRIVVDPFGSRTFSKVKFTTYQLLLGLSEVPADSGVEIEGTRSVFVGIFTENSLDRTLTTPIDFTKVVTIFSNGMCSALPSSVTPSCAVRVWFIGTPLG
jgi:hypothetical protein